MKPKHALVRRRTTAPRRQITLRELMPPERRYRPVRTLDGSVMGTFFFVFGTVFALLWLSASLVPVFVLMTLYFARTFVIRTSHAAAVQQNQGAVELLNAGRVDEAAAIFDRLTVTERNTPAHAVYVFNRAVTFILQGRPRRAYSLFNAILHSHAFHFGFSHIYLPLLYVEVATCLALMGETEAARIHRGNALKAMQDEEIGRLVFLDAIVLAREGQFGAVDDIVRKHRREAEALLRAPTLKGLQLVHAFALARMGQSQTARWRMLVDGARPAKRGEFDWIAAQWPEFGAFLRDVSL